MSDIDKMTTLQIAEYLKGRQFDDHQAKQKLEREAENLHAGQTGVYIYEASDYCGLKVGNLEFYYGYEVTDKSNEDEWCFVAREDGIAELTIPTSELYPTEVSMMWYLLSGIGQYLQRKKVRDD